MTPSSFNVAHEECRKVSRILALVGNKWSVLVVMLLGEGPRRFSEIKRSVEGISQRMLTLTLRGLERDGMVTRTVFPTVPPRVDYDLTDLGRSLCGPCAVLGGWAREHAAEIDRARAEFDRRLRGAGASSPLPAGAPLLQDGAAP